MLDYDLKALIKLEHRRAELQRLEDGWAGCGCADCQAFYSTLDLTYGSRVHSLGDFTYVTEDKVKIAKLTGDSWVGADQIFLTGGQGYATAPDGSTIFLGAESEILEALKTGKVPSTSTPQRRAEFLRVFKLVKEGEDGKEPRYQPDRITGLTRGRIRNQRAPAAEVIKSRLRFSRKTSAGKRISLHPVVKDQPGLLD